MLPTAVTNSLITTINITTIINHINYMIIHYIIINIYTNYLNNTL